MDKLKIATRTSAMFYCLALCSCSAILPQKDADNLAPQTGSGSEKTRVNLLARETIESIRKGDLASASRTVNSALSYEPENPDLHFLNGFVYHLLAGRGDPAQRNFAETGYLLALNFAPDHPFASYFLGQLYLDDKRWRDAQERFAQSIWIDDAQPKSYLGLAVASYYARDLPTAGWAIKKGLDYRPTDSGYLRAAVMVSSASGNQDSARSLLERYRNVELNPKQYAAIERRVQQWGDVHGQQPTIMADAVGRQEANIKPEGLPNNDDQAAIANRPGNENMGSIATGILPDWRDCDANKISSSYQSGFGGGNYGGYSSDETEALPALPAPCDGKPLPRMAIIDATILRTDNINTTNNGLNLLDSLSIVLTGSTTDTTVKDFGASTNQTRTITRSFGLPSAGITYSLNLFNATEARAEVLARPSLVALDRKPSQFFSGSTISVALPGQYGGNLIDKPIGVSLSVTPTFINQETMLLAVKVSRSYVEPGNSASTFSQRMQTSRNTVTANVMINYGQTLILSGLSERESTENSSGVPVLKDLPVFQYMFGIKSKTAYSKSVVVLLTPRMPLTGNDIPLEMGSKNQSDKQAQSERVKNLLRKAGFSPESNMIATFRHMNRNIFYKEFRNDDLPKDDWRRESYFKNLLNDFTHMLFF